jgi:hypothetical protein
MRDCPRKRGRGRHPQVHSFVPTRHRPSEWRHIPRVPVIRKIDL